MVVGGLQTLGVDTDDAVRRHGSEALESPTPGGGPAFMPMPGRQEGFEFSGVGGPSKGRGRDLTLVAQRDDPPASSMAKGQSDKPETAPENRPSLTPEHDRAIDRVLTRRPGVSDSFNADAREGLSRFPPGLLRKFGSGGYGMELMQQVPNPNKSAPYYDPQDKKAYLGEDFFKKKENQHRPVEESVLHEFGHGMDQQMGRHMAKHGRADLESKDPDKRKMGPLLSNHPEYMKAYEKDKAAFERMKKDGTLPAEARQLPNRMQYVFGPKGSFEGFADNIYAMYGDKNSRVHNAYKALFPNTQQFMRGQIEALYGKDALPPE